MKVYESASKIVLIILTIALIVGLFMKIVDPKDFMNICLMVYSFYFGSKMSDGNKSK